MFVWLMFAGMGTLFVCVGIYLMTQGLDFMSIFWTGFSSIFMIMGWHGVIREIEGNLHKKNIIKNGKRHLGKIVDYEDDYSMTVNGVPLAYVVVEFTPYGEVVKGKFKTGSTMPSKWPIGSTVYIYELDKEYAWDKKIVKVDPGHFHELNAYTEQ